MQRVCLLFLILCLIPVPVFAADAERVVVTVAVASNNGNDIALDNDAYRDEVIRMFSYSSYKQVDEFALKLKKAERQRMALPGGYELMLTLQGRDADRYLVQAVIRANGTSYVDTVLSILKPGVVFLGGPETKNGILIIILEMGF